MKTSPKEIALSFISTEFNFNQLKEMISHQIYEVIDNLPQKQKIIFKQKFKTYSVDRKVKNDKI